MIHENSVEFCVDFIFGVRNINFPTAKKWIFLPYENLCKLGEYIGDLYLLDYLASFASLPLSQGIGKPKEWMRGGGTPRMLGPV